MLEFDVIVSSKAYSDLSEHISFVMRVSKEAALKLKDDVFEALKGLKTFPEKNPVFEMPKSFTSIVRKQIINGRYVALYTVGPEKVVVLRVLDSRKNFDYLLS